MKIIESFIASKYYDETLCEDGLYINDNYIVVIDGVTSKGTIMWENETSGLYAKKILVKAMEKLSGDENSHQVFQYLNSILYKQYKNNIEFFKIHTEERLRATIVIYSNKHRQIWCFGDCQYSINGDFYKKEMKIDSLLAEVRSVYLKLELLSGKSKKELCAFDTSQEIIFPIIKKQLFFSNNNNAGDYSFEVLDGFCNNLDNFTIHNVDENDMIILASDGYPILKSTWKESEDFIQEIREKDPLCIEFCKLESGFTNGKIAIDDRTYVKFIV